MVLHQMQNVKEFILLIETANKRKKLLVRPDILTAAAAATEGSEETIKFHGCP